MIKLFSAAYLFLLSDCLELGEELEMWLGKYLLYSLTGLIQIDASPTGEAQ